MPAQAETALETKSLPILEAKMDAKSGILTGYAAVKHVVDSYGDVIVDGAFANIESFIKDGYSGFNHGYEPVGFIKSAKEDERGLFVEIEFHSTDDAQRLRTKIAERIAAAKTVGMSIMYRTLDANYATRDGDEIRELKKIELAEAGFVLFPANKSATALSVKHGAGSTLDEHFEAARELAEKLIDRLSDLNEKCDGPLTAGRIKIAEKLHQKSGELLEAIRSKSAPDEPAMATDEEVAEMSQLLAVSGLI